MEFTFVTEYDLAALTAMARALRKTVRKKHSRRMHVFGAVVMVLGVFLMTLLEEITFRSAVSFLAIAAVGLSLVFEDRLNGFIAQKRMAPGTNRAEAVFGEAGYTSVTPLGRSEWSYDNILALAETQRYFAFIFSKNHAQLYDKQNLSGGTPEEFAAFIKEKTGKDITAV